MKFFYQEAEADSVGDTDKQEPFWRKKTSVNAELE